MNHFIEKCESCTTVITQCRCPSKDKEVRYSRCEKCKAAAPRVILSLDEWIQRGNALFGKDVKQWRFQCANCKEAQTAQEFLDAGISSETAMARFYFSCIGRLVKGRGCDWTLGGLFTKHKTEVIEPTGGKPTPVFEFADPKL